MGLAFAVKRQSIIISLLLILLFVLPLVAPQLPFTSRTNSNGLVGTAHATYIFSDGFESGDFSNWYSHTGTTAIITSPVHSGNDAANATGSGSYWRKWITAQDDLYFRGYFRFPSVLSSGTSVTLFDVFDTNYNDDVIAAYDTNGGGGASRWALGAPSGTTYVPATIIANHWYCVEVERKVGSGNGVATLWIDGTQIAQRTTETIALGGRALTAGIAYTDDTGFTVYGDDYVADTSYIGPTANPLVVVSTVSDIFVVNWNNFVNVTVTDTNGRIDIANVTMQVYTAGDAQNFILKWDRATNVFSEYSDPSGIVTINAAGSSNSTYGASAGWVVKFNFKFTTGFTSGACRVVSTVASTGYSTQANNTNLFNVGYVNRVFLAFADGLESQYTNATPIMDSYSIKGTFYLVYNSIGSGSNYMTWTQVAALISDGQEMGSHTRTHHDLNNVTASQLTDETATVKNDFLVNHNVVALTFDYPNGDGYNNATVTNAVTSAGYLYALSGQYPGIWSRSTGTKTNVGGYGEVTDSIDLPTYESWANQACDDTEIIIGYHQVGLTGGVSVADFTQQMAYLHNKGFTTLPMSQVGSGIPITFLQTGIATGTTGTIVTLNGTGYSLTQFPIGLLCNSGDGQTVAASTPISVSSGKRYAFSSWTNGGTLSTASGTYTTPSSPATVTVNYKTQWAVNFTSSGIAGDTSGTVVTVGGVAKTEAALPFTSWVDDTTGSTTYAYSSPVSATAGKQYAWSTTSGCSVSAQSGSVSSVTASCLVTGAYGVQYYLTVTGGNSPTGQGWYNGGVNAQASNAWVWGTSGGTRTALTNWQLDTVNQNPSRLNTGTFTTPNIAMNAAHTVNFVSATQYLLTVTGGNSITYGTASPTSDNWYDSGASTTVSSNWVWNTVAGQSRTAITNWQLDTVNQNPTRQGTGTLTTSSVSMTAYHTVAFVMTTQYYLTVTGGNSVGYGTASPTSDNWYDTGASTTVTSDWVYNTVGGTRTAVSNYAIDGANQNPTRQYTGTLTTSSVTISTYHTVAFASVTQYTLTVTLNSYGTSIPTSGTWEDSGTVVQVTIGSDSSNSSSTRRLYNGATGSGTGSYTGALNPFSVTMNAAITENIAWQVQYTITITLNGYGGSTPASGTWETAGVGIGVHITSDSSNSSTTRRLYDGVTGTGTGSYTGTGNPFVIVPNGPITENVAWKVQYNVTFAEVGLGADVAGATTVLAVNGSAIPESNLPASGWVNASNALHYGYSSPIAGSTATYAWLGTGGTLSQTLQSNTFTVTSNGTVTATYSSSGTTFPLGTCLTYDNGAGGTGKVCSLGNYTLASPIVNDAAGIYFNATGVSFPSSRFQFKAWNTSDTGVIPIVIQSGTVKLSYGLNLGNYTYSNPNSTLYTELANETVTIDFSQLGPSSSVISISQSTCPLTSVSYNSANEALTIVTATAGRVKLGRLQMEQISQIALNGVAASGSYVYDAPSATLTLTPSAASTWVIQFGVTLVSGGTSIPTVPGVPSLTIIQAHTIILQQGANLTDTLDLSVAQAFEVDISNVTFSEPWIHVASLPLRLIPHSSSVQVPIVVNTADVPVGTYKVQAQFRWTTGDTIVRESSDSFNVRILPASETVQPRGATPNLWDSFVQAIVSFFKWLSSLLPHIGYALLHYRVVVSSRI